jgi:hypothetical protein
MLRPVYPRITTFSANGTPTTPTINTGLDLPVGVVVR